MTPPRRNPAPPRGFSILRRRGWEIPSSRVTPEGVYVDRRRFLRAAAAAGLGAAAGACVLRDAEVPPGPAGDAAAREGLRGEAAVEAALKVHRDRYPAPRDPRFTLDRPLTDPEAAATYNNFYEFTADKRAPSRLARNLTLRPWALEVGGLVQRPLTLDVDQWIRRFGLEERLYRHRCVEAWAMAVPWTGFPLRRLLEAVAPLASARFVRFVSFLRPEEAEGQRRDTWYPWPYHEALRLDEAVNELAFLATGIYGRPMPPQHGAPIRLVIPWKYGYKSIKSVVRIELTRDRPPTFWNTLQPDEYDFLSNVNPAVPHPRWSQARERLLGSGEVVPTLPYNGYGKWVAALYRS